MGIFEETSVVDTNSDISRLSVEREKYWNRKASTMHGLEAAPARGSLQRAAEITCIQQSTTLVIPWAELNPSDRTPRPDTCQVILIRGPVSAGDSAKAQLLGKSHPFVHRVKLWSSGGLVEEAMKIGRQIRKGLLETDTATETYMPKLTGRDGKGRLYGSGRADICIGAGCHCASACFLIWAAGVNRSGDAIGLHRPTTASTTSAKMPPDRASVLYGQLLTDIGNYLVEMEIPRRS